MADISPYKTLLDKLPTKAKVMVDDNVRSFITQDLIDLGAAVFSQSLDVAAIRETKSEAEVNILRAVPTLTAVLTIGEHCDSGCNSSNPKACRNRNDRTHDP